MNINLGILDRLLRALVGIVIAVVYLTGSIQGFTAIVFALVGLFLIGTSVVGFCPIYFQKNLSTKNRKTI
ncbi:DUF2892 domain-containing protein [Leptospira sp. 'Mane']|uniref:YgaP family membrane protein n=1 Tax=Leptospira sp. 'Mane' TaxID=3387407 RepID=UPI00398B737A